jgi:hypothetical protein
LNEKRKETRDVIDFFFFPHLPHFLQWWARSGLGRLHFVQKRDSPAFDFSTVVASTLPESFFPIFRIFISS